MSAWTGTILVEEKVSFQRSAVPAGQQTLARTPCRTLGRPDYYPSGQFILASTVETFNIPMMLSAQVSGKSSWGRMGIMVHVTAGFIDPGFSGKITLEIVNMGHAAVALPTGKPIAQITFDELSQLPANRYGKHHRTWQSLPGSGQPDTSTSLKRIGTRKGG